VAKRKGENYQLFWREDRADFVRLAAKFDAIIVPFAAVGGDDAFDVFMVSSGVYTPDFELDGTRIANMLCSVISKAVAGREGCERARSPAATSLTDRAETAGSQPT